MEMKKKENRRKERENGFLQVHPPHPARMMRTARNQLISSSKRVVTETFAFL